MINEIKEKILDEIRYGELNNDNGLLPTWLNKPEIPHHAEYMRCFQDGVTCKRYTDAVIVKNIFKELEKVDVPDTNVGEWIPCSERLPEDGENVLVWFEYFRYGEFNGLFQTCGISWTWKGRWSGFVNGESGWHKLKILAWMPLPEPYKEEGADHEE